MTEREIAEIGKVAAAVDEEVAAGCGEPKDESPTVAARASSDNREAKLSP